MKNKFAVVGYVVSSVMKTLSLVLSIAAKDICFFLGGGGGREVNNTSLSRIIGCVSRNIIGH